MSSSAREDEGRYYQNTLEDYSESNAVGIVDVDKKDVHDSLKATLNKKILKLLQRLDDNKREWINNNDPSIYTGNSGIAYVYYLYAKRFNDLSYLSRAAEFTERLTAVKSSKRDITFLTGEAGRLALGAVIHHSLDNPEQKQSLITKLKTVMNYATLSYADELLYGKAGYLYALLFVNKNISPAPIEGELIKKLINYILMSGKSYSASKSCKSPLMYRWHDTEYLGGAHGLAGILYILLQAREYLTEKTLKDTIKPSLQYLQSLRYSSGNFPSSVGSKSDRLVHWCHGAPSMTMLFILAHEVFGDECYLETAINCGEVVWTRGLIKKGCGICHGVAGNAYTFLCLYQKTQDLKYLYRACKFAQWCFDYDKRQNRIPDRPFSLFEGLAGIIYFFIDIMNPSIAQFPAYSL